MKDFFKYLNKMDKLEDVPFDLDAQWETKPTGKSKKTVKKSAKLNENYGNDGFMYITKHGIGPGTLPKDAHLLKSKDLPHYLTAIWLDRFLTTDELKYYDIYPETMIRTIMDRYDITEKDIMGEACAPKKGKKKLVEGPGAGYTITGTLDNIQIHDFTFSVNNDIVTVNCNIDAVSENTEAYSYYYGDLVGNTPVTISKVQYYVYYDEEDSIPNITEENVREDLKYYLDGIKYEALVGSGWAHTTFDGNIVAEKFRHYNGEDSDVFYLEMKCADPGDIDYIDDAVTGRLDEIDGEDDTIYEDYEIPNSEKDYRGYKIVKIKVDNPTDMTDGNIAFKVKKDGKDVLTADTEVEARKEIDNEINEDIDRKKNKFFIDGTLANIHVDEIKDFFIDAGDILKIFCKVRAVSADTTIISQSTDINIGNIPVTVNEVWYTLQEEEEMPNLIDVENDLKFYLDKLFYTSFDDAATFTGDITASEIRSERHYFSPVCYVQLSCDFEGDVENIKRIASGNLSADEIDESIGHKNKKSKKLTEKIERDEFSDIPVDVYDLDTFILNETDGEYKSFYFSGGAAILIKKDGSGCIVDYEAVGKSFNSINDKIIIYLEKNYAQDTATSSSTTDDGVRVISTFSVVPDATATITIKEILDNASKKVMTVDEFFYKRNYNSRCINNFEGIIEFLPEVATVKESLEDNGLTKTTLKAIKKGTYFTFKPVEDPAENLVYVRDEYDRETRKYGYYKWADVNNWHEKKGDTPVYIGFTF